MASSTPTARTARKSVSERLLARLQKEAPEAVRSLLSPAQAPRSLRPGLSARQAGAWSWELELAGGNLIGSQFTMSQILAAPDLGWSRYFSDWEVDPEPPATSH